MIKPGTKIKGSLARDFLYDKDDGGDSKVSERGRRGSGLDVLMLLGSQVEDMKEAIKL